MKLTQEVVRELLDYDGDTGKLIWKHRDIKWFRDLKQKASHNQSIWNGRYAGKEAFTTISNGYRNGAIFHSTVRAHIAAWIHAYGDLPEEIDHINGIRSDNRIINLRGVTKKENVKNKCIRSDNTSGYNGVSKDKYTGKWLVQARSDGKSYHRRFSTLFAAVYARHCISMEMGFHANHGRKP